MYYVIDINFINYTNLFATFICVIIRDNFRFFLLGCTSLNCMISGNADKLLSEQICKSKTLFKEFLASYRNQLAVPQSGLYLVLSCSWTILSVDQLKGWTEISLEAVLGPRTLYPKLDYWPYWNIKRNLKVKSRLATPSYIIDRTWKTKLVDYYCLQPKCWLSRIFHLPNHEARCR